MLTQELLTELWRPQGNAQVSGLIAQIAGDAPVVFSKYGLTDDLSIAHAMAQFTVECGSGREMTENINYTPDRACDVWGNRFSSADDCLAKVHSFRGDPDFKMKLIDQVYGGRNGNTQPHDGSRYIGRGLSQVTGRGNYKALADKLQNRLDLVGDPDLVNTPENALECGVADFVVCECLPFALHDDVIEVSQHLNGGFVGFPERTQWLARWKRALGLPPKSGTMLWVQQSLNALGANPRLDEDAIHGDGTKAALQRFQTENGLTASGLPTRGTIAAIKHVLPVA